MLEYLNLRLFDGEGGDGGSAESAPVGAEGGAITDGPDRQAEFDKFIELNKDLYDKRVAKQVQDRHKDYQALKQRADSLNPVLELLGGKYGVDTGDIDSLVRAIQDDDSYYEAEAMDKGLTVEQLKHIKQMERENAEYRRAAEERERYDQAHQIQSMWEQQSVAMKQMVPNFDLENELSHPDTGSRFADLLSHGVDVKTAYEVVHMDEIMQGGMQYAVQQTKQKLTNDIRARGMRPVENGSGTAVSTSKPDPSKWTKAERDEIAKRAMRGERIEL